MAGKFLMSFDLGGSRGRVMLFNIETGEITPTSCSWRFSPDQTAGGYAFDFGCDEKWRALCQAGRQALAKAGAGARDVLCISATGMRFGLVLLGRRGQVLTAFPNRDARAFQESLDLQDQYGNELYPSTGHVPGPILMAPRLLWIKKHHPEYLEEGAAVLTISDWLVYQLCGVAASEPTQAGETGLFDLNQQNWSDEILRALELPASLFPQMVSSGARLGVLTASSAAALGLAEGIPVAAGGADTQLGLLGMGITRPGELGVVAGSTTPVMVTTDKVCIDAQHRTWTGMYALPGMYVVESNAGSMGTALEWFANLLYAGLPDPVRALCGDAANCMPGAAGILSTLGTQLFNASVLTLPVDGLSFSTMFTPTGAAGRSHLARAVLEGMACSVRQNAEQAMETTKGTPQQVYLGGGMTRSALWSQMICDVFNRPIVLGPSDDASAFGAVLCAAVGASLYPGIAEAAKALVRSAPSLSPTSQAAQSAELYSTWRAYQQSQAAADEVTSGPIMQAMQTARPANGWADPAFRPRIYVSAEVGEEAIQKMHEFADITYAPYSQAGNVLLGDDLAETLRGYQVLVTEVDLVDAQALQKCGDLRLVVACRGNPTNIDLLACTSAGIPVVNTPGRNADAVADLAVSFMIMLARKLDKAAAFLHQPGIEAGDMGRMGQAYFTLKGSELWHKTVGIIGAGAVGRKVIRRLLPFEARVLVYDPYVTDEQAALLGASKVTLEELLTTSDFVSLHAPDNVETTGMINAATLKLMKPGAFLINTARAALVVRADLLAALQSGHLGGAAVDVFPVEPPGSDDPLLACASVIATPHIGGNTVEVGIHQGEMIVDELKRMLSGEQPRYVLNPETLNGFRWAGARHYDPSRLAELTHADGPSISDLDLKNREATATSGDTLDKPKSKGWLSGFKQLIGGEAKVAQPSASSTAGAPDSAQAAWATFTQIIERFISLMREDPDALIFARNKNVTFQYIVKDAGVHFYTGFIDGQIKTGMGDSPDKVDVTIRTDAATLDGMFTGRLDGLNAFKTGKLSVNGNMMKAVVMQKLNYAALYNRSRADIGDPGDLAVKVTAAPVELGPLTRQAAAPGIIQKTGDIRDNTLEINNEMYAKGWITSTGGNVSARSEDHPNEVWITPSGLFKGSLRTEMFVKIDLEGNLIGETVYNASSEWNLHCAIYRMRPEIKAVIHTHALHATLMALTGTKWLPISTEVAFLGEIPTVPFIMPGSVELGDAVARAIGAKGLAVILQNHGLVVAGSDLRRAADMTEAIEVTAKKLLWCRKLGVAPVLIPDDIVTMLRDIGSMVA